MYCICIFSSRSPVNKATVLGVLERFNHPSPLSSTSTSVARNQPPSPSPSRSRTRTRIARSRDSLEPMVRSDINTPSAVLNPSPPSTGSRRLPSSNDTGSPKTLSDSVDSSRRPCIVVDEEDLDVFPVRSVLAAIVADTVSVDTDDDSDCEETFIEQRRLAEQRLTTGSPSTAVAAAEPTEELLLMSSSTSLAEFTASSHLGNVTSPLSSDFNGSSTQSVDDLVAAAAVAKGGKAGRASYVRQHSTNYRRSAERTFGVCMMTFGLFILTKHLKAN